jgi:hypothetical protein
MHRIYPDLGGDGRALPKLLLHLYSPPHMPKKVISNRPACSLACQVKIISQCSFKAGVER